MSSSEFNQATEEDHQMSFLFALHDGPNLDKTFMYESFNETACGASQRRYPYASVVLPPDCCLDDSAGCRRLGGAGRFKTVKR